MELVIDANIVISAIISLKGKTADIIFNDGIKLFAPEWLAEEFEEHRVEIAEKAGLSEPELELALLLIFSKVNFIPFSEFEKYISDARKISPDPDDTEYFAIALKMNCTIWSDDKKLKQQDSVDVINTSELIQVAQNL